MCPNFGRTLGALGQKRLLGDDQIGQGEQHAPLRAVLCEPPVAQLALPEQVLDDVEGVLDAGADLRL
jgi:hypothetical protein